MLHLVWNTSLPSMKLVVQNINCLWCICEKFPLLFKSTSEISFYQMIYSNMSHNTLWGYYRSLLFPVADTKTICESANSISQNYLCRNGNMISKFNMGIISAPYFPYYVPKDINTNSYLHIPIQISWGHSYLRLGKTDSLET